MRTNTYSTLRNAKTQANLEVIMKKTLIIMAMAIVSVFFFAACGSKVASNGNAAFVSGGNAGLASSGNVVAPIVTSGNVG